LRPVAVVVQGGNLHKFIEEKKQQKGGGDKNLLRGCAAAVRREVLVLDGVSNRLVFLA